MKLRDYIIRRFLLLIPVLIGITFITFFLTHNIPGYDPASPWMKEKTTLQSRELIVKQHHLDEPVAVQYFYYMDDLLHLDLGLSASEGDRPVVDALVDYFPATLELTIASLLITVLLGIPMGIISAIMKDRLPGPHRPAVQPDGHIDPRFLVRADHAVHLLPETRPAARSAVA